MPAGLKAGMEAAENRRRGSRISEYFPAKNKARTALHYAGPCELFCFINT
jgi:hypothetical protein